MNHTPTSPVALGLLALAAAALTLPAQAPAWARSSIVEPRSAGALAWDSTRQRVLLFGGFGVPGRYDDTWEWDGTSWAPPPARSARLSALSLVVLATAWPQHSSAATEGASRQDAERPQRLRSADSRPSGRPPEAQDSKRSQDGQKPIGYTDTPLVPDTQWHVHDPARPAPRVVAPGDASRAPADAIVLFAGKSLDAFTGRGGKPAGWKVENDWCEANRTGDLVTKESFGSCQLHLEFCAPVPPKGVSQERGNSGVFLMSRYEVQVLDSYENRTYADGQCAAIYGQTPPLVNASRPPGEWQSYDIVFRAPKFEGDTVVAPAYVTVLHNGVVVQDHTQILGLTHHKSLPAYKPHAAEAPIVLQDHGNPVRYRNMWVRRL